MEFFEKAHVSNSKPNSRIIRKEAQTEASIKKQLKHMLHGYKENNNEAIRNSENIIVVSDDDSSVSGFSDLNLTNSSNDADITQNTVSSSSSAYSNVISDDKPSNSESRLKRSPLYNIPESDSEQVSFASISLSHFTQSLSLDTTQETQDDTTASEASLNMSLDSLNITISTDDEIEANESSSFDKDGILAAKILKRLNKPIKVEKSKKKKLLKGDECQISKGFTKEINEKRNKKSYIVDRTSKIADDKKTCKVRKQVEVLDQAETETSDESNVVSDYNASPFVSISATSMNENKTFDDIFGEYRYSTMKNLPSDAQNQIFTNNSDLFLSDDLQPEDVSITEKSDIELHEDLVLEDIEDDLKIDTNPLNDVSSNNNGTGESEEVSAASDESNDIDNPAFDPIQSYYGRGCCIIVLRHPGELFIHGKVKVKSMGGTIEILGYHFKDEICEVYSPNYNYAQHLRTVEKDNTCYGLFGKLTSSGLSVSDAEDIVTTLGQYDGVICLRPLKDIKMDFVENNFNVTDLFCKPTKYIDISLKKASEMLGCSLYLSKPLKCFEENIAWTHAVNCGLNSQSRGIVCGGKGTGKSTFLRYYINRLLSQGPVLVIDLDPGQCEFTVAGNVSATIVNEPLLGPSFTHLRTPEIMLNLGIINTMEHSRRYADAVETLLIQCRNTERLQNMPWIVNTMGMTNALGLKFISIIILQLHPTFLLQIHSKNVKKRFEHSLYPHTVQQLYSEYKKDRLFKNIEHPINLNYTFIKSDHTDSVKNNYSLAPRDERYLNFLAYFGGLVKGNLDLLGVVPYEVNIKDLNIGANVKIAEDALAQVINGKIIALCQHTGRDSPRVFTLGDKPMLCHGHGLIRGIDYEKGLLYIITPTAAERLPYVDTLLYADWVPELRGQEAQLPPGIPVPYRTASQYLQRQLMFPPKRRFNPLQLLKMSRSS